MVQDENLIGMNESSFIPKRRNKLNRKRLKLFTTKRIRATYWESLVKLMGDMLRAINCKDNVVDFIKKGHCCELKLLDVVSIGDGVEYAI